MPLRHLAVLVIGLAVASNAQATLNAAVDGKSPVQLDVKLSIAEQLALVESAMGTEHYSEIGQQDRAAVRDALGRIRANIGDAPSVDGLAPDIRNAVFNDQELVNTIMTRAHADSRMVCERVQLTGSNRREQICMTVGQRREMRENSKDALRNYNRFNLKQPGEA